MDELVRITEDDFGVKWIDVRDIHLSLKLGRDYSTWLKVYLNKMKARMDIDYKVRYFDLYYNTEIEEPRRQAGYRSEYMLTLDFAIDLVISQSYNPNKKPLLQYLFSKSNQPISLTVDDRRTEIKFGDDIIKNLFNGYTIIPQHVVLDGEYRIDWYIKELNLAIEYDERGHYRNLDEDNIRQKRIEERLNCKFLRYRE